MSGLCAKCIVTTKLTNGAPDHFTQKSKLAEWARLGLATTQNAMLAEYVYINVASQCNVVVGGGETETM